MSIRNNFPTIRPSLNLDFANVKALDPRITFTRTTTATYYDGKTTAKAEENLLLQSQDFTTTWTNVSSSDTANTTAAPDGTTTADTVTATGTGAHYVQQTSLSTTGTQRVFSCFVKAGTNNYVQLGFGTSVTAYANFDITSGSGAVGTVGATATASIVDAGNGWYRCIVITSDATASALCFIAIIQSSTDTRLQSFAAAGTETIILWGAQLEQRSAVTAYTPTTTQPITNYVPTLLTAPAGVARFDHNPTTGESLGLLVEEQRTNLVTYSEQFDNADWTKVRTSITANTIVAPSGALTGDKIISSTDNNTHFIFVLPTIVANTNYAFSVFAKAGEYNSVRIRFGKNGSPFTRIGIIVNLLTGAITNSDVGTPTSVSIRSATLVGNGWYKVAVAGIADTTSTDGFVSIEAVDNSGNTSYTGDGYSGIYIWGAQLEAGAFPTSYIPTVAATVTRNADAATMTGTNFSSWYRADEGTVYSNFSSFRPADSANAFAYEINQDSTNYTAVRTAAGYTPDRIFPAVVVGGSGQFTGESTVTTGYLSMPVGSVKNALAYKANDFAASWNGVTPLVDTSGTLPTPASLFVGVNGAQNAFLNGHIRKLSFYPARLSDAQLVALTTV